ncbi:recombinase family protein [Photobacterium leiognathi]|uniref:recombinase family protein n=1 Tax=Photobacterium leiognathi TaxID=553611 RepID=UPI002981FC99|nr:recombinase family protein [Photobacterium leiognathi]
MRGIIVTINDTVILMIQPKIYLYSRISSMTQLKGTGLQQQRSQKSTVNELSQKYQLPISNETFEDIGVSAYKGDHLKASFGRIIEAIQSGRIAKGSIIVVFSLDRISRQQVNVAMELFLSVINKGVSIYTTVDNILYDHNDEHIAQNIILSVLTMQRAHEESKTKSKRTTGSALTIAQGIIENNPDYIKDGFCKAIKSVGSHPWWLDVTSDFVKPDPIYFPVAQEIVRRIINLESTVSIFRWLKATYPAPTRSRGNWDPVLIDKFSRNPMLTGDRTINFKEQTITIPNYAPAVCSQKDFDLMRAARAGKYKKDKAPTPKVTGLLNGINVLKCGICGSGMSCNRTGKYYRYACIDAANGKSSHAQWGTPIQYIENYITEKARIKAFQSIANPASDRVKELLIEKSSLEQVLKDLESEYNEYRSDGIRPPRILINELSSTETKLDEVQLSIDSERVTSAKGVLPNVWRQFFSENIEADFLDRNNIDLRLQFKNVLRHMITRIEATPTKKKDRNRTIVQWVVHWEIDNTVDTFEI